MDTNRNPAGFFAHARAAATSSSAFSSISWKQQAWRWIGICALVCAAMLTLAPQAHASHFRYANISWEPTGKGREVKFNLTAAFRRNASEFPGSGSDGFAVVGDIITEEIGNTNFIFGDGDTTGVLQFVVTAFSATDDFIICEALDPGDATMHTRGILHTYASDGPFTAGIASSSRIANLNNRSLGAYTLLTTVRLNGNRSPKTTLVPVVAVPESATASFVIPASDPDGDKLRFRLATNEEAGGGSSPTNLSINSNTGVITWNTQELDKTNFWTVQVIIEDLDAQGNVKTQTPVDFLLQIKSGGNFPTGAISPAGPFVATVGQTLTFTVTGNDVDPNSTVTIGTGGLPQGATTTPGLPLTGLGTGTSVTFKWTPNASQVGTTLVIFSVTDDTGAQILLNTSITVSAAPVTIAGHFTGFVADADGHTGSAVLQVMANGSFSGTITLTGVGRKMFKGTLDANNQFSASVPGIGTVKGAVGLGNGQPELHVEIATNTSVYEGTLVISALKKAHRFLPAGNYTMLLPPDDSQLTDSTVPRGVGFAVVVADNSGNIRFVGSMGDGAKFGTGAGTQADGGIPFIAGLYADRSGQVQGLLTATPTSAESDFAGVLHWTKPANASDAFYLQGFTATINAVGSFYKKPAKQNKILTLNASGVVDVTMSDGNLAAPITTSATIPAVGLPQVVAPLRSLSFVKATGLFSGFFFDSASQQSRTYRGIVFQKKNLGQGFFLGSDQSGRVNITPKP
jgi:Putative Ig domain